MKWQEVTEVLQDIKRLLKVNKMFYKTVVKPRMIYGSECEGNEYFNEIHQSKCNKLLPVFETFT